MGPNQYIILYVFEGYWSIVKTVYVKIMHAHHVFTPLCGRLSNMTLTLPCMSNKSSYFSQITFYNKHAISDIQSPLRFHYISCISSYLGDDVMMLPSRSVKALQEPSLMGIMRCDWIRLGFFPFVLGGHNWGINICNIISEMWHISILPFHP